MCLRARVCVTAVQGIRCIEDLQYQLGGNLSWHVDGDSIYTITVMLGRQRR